MIDFTGVKAITIPEGAVKKIMRGADVLWEKVTGYTNIIDTIGYTDGVRLNSSGTTTAAAGYTTTGMIDIYTYPHPVVVEAKGANFIYSTSCYIVIYSNDGGATKIGHTYIRNLVADSTVWNGISITADADGNIKITVDGSSSPNYFRITGYGRGENLIVTINEPIT